MNAWRPFSKIIENLNLIVKLERQWVLKDASSGIEGVILVIDSGVAWWLSRWRSTRWSYALLSLFKRFWVDELLSHSSFENKTSFPQSNPTSHKSCWVHSVPTLALLIHYYRWLHSSRWWLLHRRRWVVRGSQAAAWDQRVGCRLCYGLLGLLLCFLL